MTYWLVSTLQFLVYLVQMQNGDQRGRGSEPSQSSRSVERHDTGSLKPQHLSNGHPIETASEAECTVSSTISRGQ